MVEKISRLLKIIAALSLLLLSLLLLLWVFYLDLNYSLQHIFLILIVVLLVFLFVKYSIALLKQVFQAKSTTVHPGILDEEELNRHKNND